jgi:soluble lytic murein transglycosylase-like protein
MKFLKTAIIILVLITAAAAYPKISKRLHPDGTVEYYGRGDTRVSGKPLKIQPSKFDAAIEKAAQKRGLDPFLIKCIIKVESDFNPGAVSAAGAMGLMQVMQETANYYKIEDALDPEQNLYAGTNHFAGLLKYFDGDIPLALAAYHAGLGRVKKNRSIPPIKATVDYVNTVMRYFGHEGDYAISIKRLYSRIEKDGTLIIFSK